MEKKETKKIEETKPAPNVAFAGKEWRTDESGEMKLLPSRFAPEKLNTATKPIRLPDSEIQVKAGAKGFYSEHADWLIATYPDTGSKEAGIYYKKPKAKGE